MSKHINFVVAATDKDVNIKRAYIAAAVQLEFGDEPKTEIYFTDKGIRKLGAMGFANHLVKDETAYDGEWDDIDAECPRTVVVRGHVDKLGLC